MRSKVIILAVAAGLAATGAFGHDARTNYILHCQGCHTATGAGLEGKVPDLRPTILPMARLPAGRAYLIQVPGVSQSPLSDVEVAAVLNWMLRNLSDRKAIAGLRAFTQTEVRKYRASRLLDVRAARERVLAGIAAN